ncbi:MAG: hypothetical protein HYX41_01745 [Bdellovibrio sp.]|nr:hypothetical protein [Bdellovibrio sp.]
MLKHTQKLFVYQRKEIILIGLIGSLSLLFSFIFGIHLAKNLGTGTARTEENEVSALESSDDPGVSREELSDPGKDAPKIVEDSLNQELHEEVTRTGIRLRPSRAVELPTRTKSKTGGATQLEPELQKHPKH